MNDAITVLPLLDFVILFIAFLNLSLGIIVYLRDRKNIGNISFMGMTLGALGWVLGLSIGDILHNYQDITIWFSILAHISAGIMVLSLVYFSTYFTHKKYKRDSIVYIFTIYMTIILMLTSVPSLVIKGLFFINEERVLAFGPVYSFYVAGILFGVFLSLWRLSYKYKKASGKLKKSLLYIYSGLITVGTLGLFSNLIAPMLGMASYFAIGPIASSVIVIFVGYAIVKYDTWNLSEVRIEIITTTLIVLSLINVISDVKYLSQIEIFIIRLSIIIATLYSAYFLVRLFNKEKKQTVKLKKLNKELKELDEKKTEFLHIATHQLRGPVTAINGYASMLGDGDYGPLNKKVKVTISKILSAGIVMRETISDYMNIARIEENHLNQAPTNFKLCDLVTDRVSILQEVAHKKGLEIILSPTEGAHDCEVHADRENITQVVNALLENAIKYTKKGTITLTPERSKDGKSGMLHITDTGIGVAPKDLDGLFRKFARASNAKATNIFGTGMGLFIAKSLTEANGGGVTVHSDGLNKGTTFTIELPIVN